MQDGKDPDVGKRSKQVRLISVKRGAVLGLPLAAYRQWADSVENGLLMRTGMPANYS
jgi:hypothetical protein